ncbi:MAG: hypothetical protein IKN41_07640 [Candidatus Methanomethylophilaceae archaeon]|nr:hypothetical protein [Candidatus Methanomethylophilaceae archaeon]
MFYLEEGANLTIKGAGTLEMTGENCALIRGQAGAATLTVDGVTFKTHDAASPKEGCIAISMGRNTSDASVITTTTIVNCNFSQETKGAPIWISYHGTNNVTIDNCSISSKGVGAYLGVINEATVKNTQIRAEGTALEIKSGKVTVQGCSLSSNEYVAGNGSVNGNGTGGAVTTLVINNGYSGNNMGAAVDVTVKNTVIANSVSIINASVTVSDKNVTDKSTMKVVSDSSMSMDTTEIKYSEKARNDKSVLELSIDSTVVGTISADDSGNISTIPAGTNVVITDVKLNADDMGIAGTTELIVPSNITIDATSKPLTVSDDAVLNIEGGTVKGTIKSGDNYITFPSEGTKGNFTIVKGSVYINGEITTASTIEVRGNVVVEGSATENITIKATAATNLSFGVGFEVANTKSLTIDVNGNDVVIANDSVIGGNVIFDDTAKSTKAVKLAANFTALGAITKSTNVDTFAVNSSDSKTHTMAATTPITELTAGSEMIIFAVVSDEGVLEVTGNITQDQIATYDIFVLVDNSTLSLDLPEGKTIYLNGYILTIDADIKVTKAKIIEGGYQKYTNEGGSVQVSANKVLTLDTADIIADINADTGASVIVAVAKTQTIDGQTISDVAVGYGNTLTIRNLTFESGNTVKAFGTLIIEGTTTIGAGAYLHIAESGEAFVTGTLAVAGTAIVEGQMTVSGTVSINGLSNKSATFMVTSEIDADDEDDFGVLVLSGAKFSLLAPSNTSYKNTLIIAQAVNAFIVYGELNLNGTFTGAITDLGDVKVNGSAYSSTIYIFDEVSVTITSVTGTLAVSDAGAAKVEKGSMTPAEYSDGNVIYLNNVKAVTIYDAVNTKVSTTGVKYFWADMYIGGVTSNVATGVAGTIRMSASDTSSTSGPIGPTTNTERYGQIYVPESLTLGENITLYLNKGTVVVDGAVYALAANSGIVAEADSTITVNGTVSVGLKAAGQIITGTGTINAAYVTVTESTTADKTGIYAALDNIVSDIAMYDDSKITILGTVSSSADFDLKSGESIIVSAGAELTLEGDVKVAEGATINNSGNVTVSNYLYAANFAGSLIGNAAVSDVVVSEGNAKTLMSLARAIKEGMKEIALANNVKISSDLTIPEDVVVNSNGKSITIDKRKTLTVNGGLVMSDDKLPDVSAKNSSIVVNGYFMTRGDLTGTYATLEGAHFKAKVGGYEYNVISNITYATLLCGSGTITVYGHLSAGDIVLKKDPKAADLKIVITNISTDKLSSLTVSSLTLVGSTLDLETSDGVFNGTVTALCGDGSDLAEIAFSDARGVVVSTSEVEKPAGTEYALLINGTIAGATDTSFGKIVIADGIVTLNGSLTATGKNTIAVALGATLDIVSYTLTAGAADDIKNENVCLINFGTIAVDGGKLAVAGIAANYGIIYAESNKKDAVLVTGVVYNLGSMIMSEETGKVAHMKVGDDSTKGHIIVGEKPEELGAIDASISGYVDYGNDTSYIIAYPGADLSEAKIKWNEGLGVNGVITSDLIINGEVYMTIVVIDGKVTFNEIITVEEFELIGVQTSGLKTITNWYSDIAMKISDQLTDKTPITESIPAVYAYAKIATVTGTITEGVGLKIFVDGKNQVGGEIPLAIGTHKVFYELEAGYDGTNVTVMFNGKAVPVTASGLVIDITVDMYEYTLSATGATPIPEPEPVVPEKESEWTITTILLVVLVVLIAIMAVIVALRLNRN